jgi:hypothetical protein
MEFTENFGSNHATVIVARAWMNGECHFRIRNSYGRNTHYAGEFWASESTLSDWLIAVGEVRD